MPNQLTTLPLNEVGFVDVKKFVYESIKLYVPLMEALGNENIYFRLEDLPKGSKKFILLSNIAGTTNHIGVRKELFQFDVFTESLEETDKIKNHIIDLFNRKTLLGVTSKLKRSGPDTSSSKTGLSRTMLDFDFVLKDMKY